MVNLFYHYSLRTGTGQPYVMMTETCPRDNVASISKYCECGFSERVMPMTTRTLFQFLSTVDSGMCLYCPSLSLSFSQHERFIEVFFKVCIILFFIHKTQS